MPLIKKTNALLLLLFLLMQNKSYSLEFDLIGKVETIRKGNLITLLLRDKPDREDYLIINDDIIIGKIKILSVNAYTRNLKTEYRALAECFLKSDNPDILKAGTVIGLVIEIKKEKIEYGDQKYKEKAAYQPLISTPVDNREMIIIPEGKFIFGSNLGDKDEQPQSIVYLDNYYIDKYEVSNSDYFNYVNETNVPAPASWINGKYNEGEEDFPVLVSYYEAMAYAKWAEKRLPTEEEWEKAARGPGLELIKRQDETYITIEKPVLYPWGNQFEASKANSLEFWESADAGREIKKKFKKGLLPVNYFNNTGASVYGVVNMAGNAAEWTSSWYNAYKGSKHSDSKYGTQLKVIRGGAWFNRKYNLRTCDREIGGLPNLYEDNIAGFRCVMEPRIINKIKND